MNILNEMLGHLDNSEAELLSTESQLKLVSSIEVLLFNYDNWYRFIGSKLPDCSFAERLSKFKEWDKEKRKKTIK